MSEVQKEDRMTILHAGDEYEKYMGAVTPPVFLTSLHVAKSMEDYASKGTQEDGYIYGRYSNPTVEILEKKIAALEHGEKAVAFASGMAAATAAIMVSCKAGSHVICMKNVYGGVRGFLEDYGIHNMQMEVTYVSGTDLQELEEAIRPNTDLIILESPSTFVFTVVDFEKIAEIANRHHIKTYADNTYCTPLYQKPLDYGITFVMHTISKYIGGHSDIIGGILVSKDGALMDKVKNQIRATTGGIIGPMEAWLSIRGLRTLETRLVQHQKNAKKVAAFLEGHEKVLRVMYTGLDSHPQKALIEKQQCGHTGLMSFVVQGGEAAAVKLVNGLKTFKIGCSWGGFESLAICPLYQMGEEELYNRDLTEEDRGFVRIHCGLEGADVLIEDLKQALEKI